MNRRKMEIDFKNIKQEVVGVLAAFPYKPFLCLPLSAILYALLRGKYNLNAQLLTGNLIYKQTVIFKQDFRIEESVPDQFHLWSGHAWVDLEGVLFDLSFFRTLYSEEFTLPVKQEMVNEFGVGRGALIGSYGQMKSLNLEYEAIDCLSDQTVTAILKGISSLPM